MLVNSKDLLEDARKKGYAVGAFNVNNMELVQGILSAASELKSPVILQVSKGARKYAGMSYIINMVSAAVKDNPDIKIALHLDHGTDFEICKECIDGGFSSVMIDGSMYEFEKNVQVTKKVVEYAHARGVSVEAELGKLAGVEEDIKSEKIVYTDPEEAKQFSELTGCDSLAIAIGTSHGAYKFSGEPALDFERLKKIKELVKIPLVLHGASSVPEELVKKANDFGAEIKNARGVPESHLAEAVKLGICKVNIDTDLRLAMTSSIRESFHNDPSEFDPRKYLGPARDAVKSLVARKIKMLGSAGKV